MRLEDLYAGEAARMHDLIVRVRRVIHSGQYDGVKIRCFNFKDEEEIRSYLTDEENARVFCTHIFNERRKA